MTNNISTPAVYEVVYYTDPLCCWSFGMEKHWHQLRRQYQSNLHVRYCMGGLIPDWSSYNDPQHMVSRPIQMGPVWMEAAHLTGAPIESRIWMEDPPASSYLACIAVKCAGLQSPAAEELYLHSLRSSVMTEGKNIAYASALIAIAKKLSEEKPGSIEADLFEQDLLEGNGVAGFKADLAEIRDKSIVRFPTMIIKGPAKKPVMIIGHRPYEALVEVLDSLT